MVNKVRPRNRCPCGSDNFGTTSCYVSTQFLQLVNEERHVVRNHCYPPLGDLNGLCDGPCLSRRVCPPLQPRRATGDHARLRDRRVPGLSNYTEKAEPETRSTEGKAPMRPMMPRRAATGLSMWAGERAQPQRVTRA